METTSRRAARVLLVDDTGRVPLLCGFDPARPQHRYGIAVGRGADRGETLAECAVREPAEETC